MRSYNSPQKRVQDAIERIAEQGKAITVRAVHSDLVARDGVGASFGTITPLVRDWNRLNGDEHGQRSATVTSDIAKVEARAGRIIAKAIAASITAAVTAAREDNLRAVGLIEIDVEALTSRVKALESLLAVLVSKTVPSDWCDEEAETDSVFDQDQPNLDRNTISLPLAVDSHDGAMQPNARPLSDAPVAAGVSGNLNPLDLVPKYPRSKVETAAFNDYVAYNIALVLQTQADLTPSFPSLSAGEVLRRLPTELLMRFEESYGKPLTTTNICRILRNRVDHRKYVRRTSRGCFAVLPNWQLTQTRPGSRAL